MLFKLFGLMKGKTADEGNSAQGEAQIPAGDEAHEDILIEYIYITVSSIIKLAIVFVVSLMLLFIISGDLALPVEYPKRAAPAKPAQAAAAKTTPRPAPAPSSGKEAEEEDGELNLSSWWSTHEAFKHFPVYEGEGTLTDRFKEGAEYSKEGYYQYKISNVSYGDYTVYLNTCRSIGHSPHDPFKGFVESSEIETIAQGGYVVFVSNGYRLNLYYRSYADELVFRSRNTPPRTQSRGRAKQIKRWDRYSPALKLHP